MSSEPSDNAVEKYLDLPGGRTLAYMHSGNKTSSTLVIFFHGVFGIGRTTETSVSKPLAERGVHYLTPTLPGWGKSSARPSHIPYHISLANDITALIEHLYPTIPSDFRIYVAGGSYGTVPAQMLYGAPFDIFPYGRNVVGCLVLAAFSPFRYHKDHGKSMTMANYVAVGPPTRWFPFHLLQRIASFALGTKLKSEQSAEKFVRELLFNKMKEGELNDYAAWRERYNKKEGQLEKEFASNMVKSVKDTWEGFFEVADVINSDWGFKPDEMDDEHNKRPILIYSSAGDEMAPEAMALWLKDVYKNAHIRSTEAGGHISGLFKIEGTWEEFLELGDAVQL